jgi:hypothetical protein
MRTACASIDQGGGSGDFAWNQAKCRNVGIGTFGRNVALSFRTQGVFDIQSARHAVDKYIKLHRVSKKCIELQINIMPYALRSDRETMNPSPYKPYKGVAWL